MRPARAAIKIADMWVVGGRVTLPPTAHWQLLRPFLMGGAVLTVPHDTKIWGLMSIDHSELRVLPRRKGGKVRSLKAPI